METARPSRVASEWLPLGLLLIWWGILEFLPDRPRGAGALGIAIILLGVNALSLATGGIVNRVSATLGVIALATSLAIFAKGDQRIPMEVPVFPVLLVVCGLFVLGRGFARRGMNHEKSP